MKIRSMQPHDHQLLWRLAQTGDLGAQEELVQAYQSRVAGFVYTFLGSSESVEDLAQQIFVRALVALPGIRNLDQVEAWLFRIARNACLSHLRKQKWRRLFVPYESEYHEPIAEIPVDRSEDLAWLRRAVLQLPPSQRELVALLQDADLSYEELARITGRSLSSVKSLLFRARETLKNRRHYEQR
jgi:RNA polymerase sigma-70 factor (ECF subfamily)